MSAHASTGAPGPQARQPAAGWLVLVTDRPSMFRRIDRYMPIVYMFVTGYAPPRPSATIASVVTAWRSLVQLCADQGAITTARA